MVSDIIEGEVDDADDDDFDEDVNDNEPGQIGDDDEDDDDDDDNDTGDDTEVGGGQRRNLSINAVDSNDGENQNNFSKVDIDDDEEEEDDDDDDEELVDDDEDDQDETSNSFIKFDKFKNEEEEEVGEEEEQEDEADSDDNQKKESVNQQEIDDNEEDDAEESEEDEAKQQEDPDVILVGGKVSTPSYCILEGFFDVDQQQKGGLTDDGKNSSSERKWKRETLYIRHLPAILGRSHETKDVSFVGIGTAKQLSRQQLRIEYRTTTLYPYGQLQSSATSSIPKEISKDKDDNKNTTDQDKTSPKLIYVDRVKYNDKSDKSVNSSMLEQVVKYTAGDKPPSTGFFTLTTLGKNGVNVNGEKVEQGETAYLSPGSIIKLSTCLLYFMTPKSQSKEVISVPYVSKNHESSSTTLITKSDNNSDKMKVSSVSSSLAVPIPSSQQQQQQQTAAEQYLTAQGKRAQSLQNEIDSIPTDDLLRQMSNAIRDDVWDRKHQLIGSTLSYRAVIETANDPIAQKLANENQGELSRGEIMDLIANNPRWKVWVEQMLSKMEQKSYQASITKGLIKAEFTRTATTGRYIKWLLPDLKSISKKSNKYKSSSNSNSNNGSGSKSKNKKVDSTASKARIKKEQDDEDDHDNISQNKRKVGSVGSDKETEVQNKKTRTSDNARSDEKDEEDHDDDDADDDDDDDDDDSLQMKPLKINNNNDSDDDNDDDSGEENDKHNMSLKNYDDDDNDIDDDDEEDGDDNDTSPLGLLERVTTYGDDDDDDDGVI